MWLFWRARNRFSLDELRYLADQLQKVQVVTEANKDFVIEAIRSISELVTYGDQHDPTFFEFFMEKQVMGEFARILKISRTPRVAFQLLQTMSIMIQNLKSDHSIYYIFSNEHINYLITYKFDFQNDEMLSYYISFLRAISGKLNKNTISLLIKTKNEEVESFPLYVEAVRFAFHEETMVRTAVRALTLNVYHVGDETVNKFVTRAPLSDYFSEIVQHFQKQCIDLDKLVTQLSSNHESRDWRSPVLTAVEEIEDSLYYFSDVMSSGIPDLGRLIVNNILRLLVFPLLLPSIEFDSHASGKERISIRTALYLLCCVLHIFKSKDLASTVSATLFYPCYCFGMKETLENGCCSTPLHSRQGLEASSSEEFSPKTNGGSKSTIREILLSYITTGDDVQALGSLSLFATLLQTKELDEAMLDGLGILPQRKHHKKLLLQALVGEDSGEEQLFSRRLTTFSDIDSSFQNLKEFGLCYEHTENSINPKLHRSQVLDTLVLLTCRADVSAEVRWLGAWLLRQLLPHGGEEFTPFHLSQLKEAHLECTHNLLKEAKGCWCDLLIAVVKDVFRRCKKAIEAPSPPKDPKSVLLPLPKRSSDGESSIALGERMYEMVKVFVLQRQLVVFSLGENKSNQSPINSPMHSRENNNPFSDISLPKPGSEMELGNGVPCRIAFEKGKERHFSFLSFSKGTQGYILLVEEIPLKPQFGTVRIIAPLAGSDPRIDEKHPKWLHLRIRPSTLPFLDPSKLSSFSRGNKSPKVLVDGRWTLAFNNEESCKTAFNMVNQEINMQQREVERELNILLDNDIL